MNNSQAIINFMYFANNFSQTDLTNIFTLLGGEHFKNKFANCRNDNNGTDKFFTFFMQMSDGNKQKICEYITENYKAFK